MDSGGGEIYMQFDLIVVGGGPGGYSAAFEAASHKMKVCLVEERELGGTCLNRGCIPTKTLIHTADLLRELHDGGSFCLVCGTVSADLVSLKAKKESVISALRDGLSAQVKAGRIEYISGKGTVVDAHTVEVNGKKLEAEDIIVATGSVPAVPPIPGRELPGVCTSDRILEDLPAFASLIIIGGGVIGTEIAGIYEAFGTKVTLVEALDSLLPALDSELGRSLAQLYKKRGIDVHCRALVKEISSSENGLSVSIEEKGTVKELEAESVLIATGRRANTGVFVCDPPAMEHGRILTDEAGRTDIPHLYAVGDIAAGYPQLAHTAEAMGINAVCAILGLPLKRDLSMIPSGVYTSPEIGSVGMTEKEAASAGIACVTGKANTLSNARSLIAGGERGFIKVTAEKETGRLVGAVMMCERATDLIQEMAAAIAAGMTSADLLRVVHGHPTFSEAVVPALEALERKLEI